MALAFKCDICGKLYEGTKNSTNGHEHNVTNAVWLFCKKDNGDSIGESVSYDLCPDCYKKVLTVLRKGKDDSDKEEKA